MLKRIVSYLAIFMIVLACSWALLRPEFFRVHDYVHAARVVEMARALEDGHIIPRWSQNFGFGYGMPLFEFYAPLPYFIGAIFFLFGIPMILILKLLFIICNVMTAIGSYKLGKQLDGRVGGILLAVLVTLAPYRAVNLYVRGALSEAWGIMAIPWILYGILLIYKKEISGWWIVTLATTALLLSHNLTSIIALPSIGFFILLVTGISLLQYNVKHKENLKLSLISTLKPLSITFASLLIAVGLSAFYTIPAFSEKGYTKVEQAVTTGYFEYGLHFLYFRQFLMDDWAYGGSSWGPDDDISFYFGSAQLLALMFAAITAGYILLSSYKSKKLSKTSKYFFIIIVIGATALLTNLLMTTEKTLFIWRAIPQLEFIQFPWRWLSAAIVWIGILGSISLITIKKPSLRIGIAAVVFALSIFLNGHFFQPEKYLQDFNSMYYTDAETISKSMSNILYDYMPTKVPITIVPPKHFVSCYIENVNFEKGCETSTMLLDRAHEKLFIIQTMQEQKVTVALADFPGWKVEIDGEPIQHRADDNGLIEFMVPKGAPRVGIHFASTPVRTAADIVTFLSLCTFVYLILPSLVVGTNKKKNDDKN